MRKPENVIDDESALVPVFVYHIYFDELGHPWSRVLVQAGHWAKDNAFSIDPEEQSLKFE